ncbi:hypothetical protein HPP92_006731 [Vanilla planifolia]|uniref:Uncharacterized protein n=1 Tax=Vanilla planifolia TaxID=51239 RepID=A0A835RG64_VANPL|nr:hypothetical protein HPP92_006731 [Vanilla planifolia]
MVFLTLETCHILMCFFSPFEHVFSISKAKMNEYSEKIEAIAARLSFHQPELVEAAEETLLEQIIPVSENNGHVINPASTLRRRTVSVTKVEDSNKDLVERDMDGPVMLDEEAQAHIEKHRKLQDDLTDEMVTLAQQLKESSLVMSKSLNETEKVLDSTEKAVEQSLASTGRANARAVQVYSEASKTTCFTCLIIFLMTFIFIMVVLLIRVT